MRNSLLIKSVVLISSIVFLFMAQTALAQIIDPSICDGSNPNGVPDVCVVNDDNINVSAGNNALVGENGIITRISQWLVWISGALAAILIIIAGLMFIFSSGNPESAGRARRTVLYAVIGVIVAVVGQGIVTYVLEKL